MPSDKIHKKLNHKQDQKLIESFKSGQHIQLKDITEGTQIYYLYNEDEGGKVQSWYWGCIVEIDESKQNGEYYHIHHDDEEPWIDLSADLDDWKVIPTESIFYDQEFDFMQYKAKKVEKKTTKKSKKQTTKKRTTRKVSKRGRATKSLNNMHQHQQSHTLSIPTKRYGVGNQGFASIIPKKQISCTITEGPITANAVQIQGGTCSDSYSFWVRREDITDYLENEDLEKQRVKFKLNDTMGRYKVIQTDQSREFVKCFWRENVDETWIDINNFHTKLASISLSESSSSSSTYSNGNHNNSNKENEDEDDDIVMNGSSNTLNNSKRVRRTRRNNHNKSASPEISVSDHDDNASNVSAKRKKRGGRKKGTRKKKVAATKKNVSVSISMPPLSTTSVKSESVQIEQVQENKKQSRQIRKRNIPNQCLSQPINRNQTNNNNNSQPQKKRNMPLTANAKRRNASNQVVDHRQVSMDMRRYQNLQHQAAFSRPMATNTAAIQQNNMSNGFNLAAYLQQQARQQQQPQQVLPQHTAYVIQQATSSFVQPQYNINYTSQRGNTFIQNPEPSPLATRNLYRYQQQQQQRLQQQQQQLSQPQPQPQSQPPRAQLSGQKRQRSESTSSFQQPPNKRHKCTTEEPQSVQLMAVQPPQPDIMEMPPLQQCEEETMSIKQIPSSNDNNTIQSPPFPNPSVSTLSSPSEIVIDPNPNTNTNTKPQSEESKDNENEKDGTTNNNNKFPTADDVSSIASGVNSESPNIAQNKDKSIAINIGIELKDVDNKEESTTVTTTSSTSANANNDHRNEVVSDTDSEDSDHTILSPNDEDTETRRKNRNTPQRKSNKATCDRFDDRRNTMIPRHVCSEPPPSKSQRFQVNITGKSTNSSPWNNIQLIQNQMYFPFFSMLPLNHMISSLKLGDKSLTTEERIESLRSILRYLQSCKTTMIKMTEQFDLHCQNIIICVQSLIQDLETRS